MLLRRVIEHVQAQNWFAVVLDFTIVVVGVFIGIQVSNWNESRADAARAQEYVQRLIGDLQVDIETIEDRYQFWGQVTDYGTQALAYSAAGAPADAEPWPLLLAYFQASQIAEFVSKNTTFSELKSAGELGLIPDPGLRTALAEYYRLNTDPVLLERPKFRESIRERMPLPLQFYVWETCYDSSERPGFQSLIPCGAPEFDIDESLLANLANDAELNGQLRHWMSNLRVALLISESTLLWARELQEKLNNLDTAGP